MTLLYDQLQSIKQNDKHRALFIIDDAFNDKMFFDFCLKIEHLAEYSKHLATVKKLDDIENLWLVKIIKLLDRIPARITAIIDAKARLMMPPYISNLSLLAAITGELKSIPEGLDKPVWIKRRLIIEVAKVFLYFGLPVANYKDGLFCHVLQWIFDIGGHNESAVSAIKTTKPDYLGEATAIAKGEMALFNGNIIMPVI